MLSLPPSVRIFVAIEPVDMRGSFNALAGHVRRLHREPLDGHLYFFLNKRKTLMRRRPSRCRVSLGRYGTRGKYATFRSFAPSTRRAYQELGA